MESDWTERYASGNTPWDVGAPHPELVARMAAGTPELTPSRPGARALVPGCGRGHDALALAEAGFLVTAIDLVDGLGSDLAPALAARGGEFVAGDALAFEPAQPYELLFEHTFFCALDPADRLRWGDLARRCLAKNGTVCAIVFPADKPHAEGGPPWGTSVEAIGAALGPRFVRTTHEFAKDGLERREWREEWAVWSSAPGSRK